MRAARCLPEILVVGVITLAACSLNSGPAPANTVLTGTWVTSDTALDALTLDLSQGGEVVTGAGSIAFGRVLPQARDTLTVTGSNLSDRACVSTCTPIELLVADTLGDTLFLAGQSGDATHFSATSRTSAHAGPFAALGNTVLIFSKS